MDGSSADACSNATYALFGRCWSQQRKNCSSILVDDFHDIMKNEMWRVDALMLMSVIFGGVIVGIGGYIHRYRYHGLGRYLFLGATTLLLSIISILLSANSTIHSDFNITIGIRLRETLTAQCYSEGPHQYIVILCACLVPLSAINTSVIVAGDDREARDIVPLFELLVKGIWILYLVVSNRVLMDVWENDQLLSYFQYAPFALIYAKMAYKYYAFKRARKSLALGRNIRFIVGHMQQLHQEGIREPPRASGDGDDVEDVPPPPLVVMGEEGQQVEKQPHGFLFNNDKGDNGLVTIDRIWQSEDNMLLVSMPQLKDICLSFALFKLLRCRFARYKPITYDFSMETLNIMKSVLLEDERAFGVITDELSFLHDYYHSSIPISYSAWWLPLLSISISLFSICCCVLTGMAIKTLLEPPNSQSYSQVVCVFWCTTGYYRSAYNEEYKLGSMYFGLVPMFLVYALVMLSEARDIASFICSNWTKVALVCRSMNHTSMQKKWFVGLLLRCRCNLMKNWNGKMSQCSVLVLLRPRKDPLLPLRRLLRLPSQKKNKVKIPKAVKVCIINALRSCCNNGRLLRNGAKSLCNTQAGERLFWACNGKGTSDTILMWHVATSIIEVRHPHHQHDDLPQLQGHGCSSISCDKTAATYLSRYCAYLVAFCPDLLPDDDTWTKDLYEDVKKEAECALTGGIVVSTPEEEYRQLLEKLQSSESKHDVLKNAAKLAKQLLELDGGEEKAWEVLAGFWSEMILFIAPSDNLDGHAEAIARGGELITLLWALLTHIGIIDRPGIASAHVTV